MKEARNLSAMCFSVFLLLKSDNTQIDSSKMMKCQKCPISHLIRKAPIFRVSLNDQ